MRVIVLFTLIGAGIFLYTQSAMSVKDYRAGDLGLGIATSAHVENFEGQQISETEGEYKHVMRSMRYYDSIRKKLVLLMGNSQLHSINYYSEGDHLAVYHLNQLGVSSDFRFVQLTSPNVNFQELLLNYLTLKSAGFKPNWLLIGCTYRTFQLTSLRPDFEQQLMNLDLQKANLNKDILEYYTGQQALIKEKIQPPQSSTIQEDVESEVVDFLESNWEAYRYRGNLRSKIKVMPGIVFRSTIQKNSFYQGSITTEQLNMSFLKQLVSLCRHDSVNVLLYQPPHPQSGEPFQYEKERYERCYENLAGLADNNIVFFKSFETIVPLELWGLNNSGRLDIFHFKGKGHALLAENIYNFLNEQRKHQYAIQ